jgi:hypothetical protein
LAVILSTATPPGGAYPWNDSSPKNPAIIAFRVVMALEATSVLL